MNDIVKELTVARDLFKGTALGDILERAILEIEQLRSDQSKIASDLNSGVRR
jgi:hypothetical protein